MTSRTWQRTILVVMAAISAVSLFTRCDGSRDTIVATAQQTVTVQNAIVGGEPEDGFPGVGALVGEIPGRGYQGAFCSATLVAPQWVLTSAHCLLGLKGPYQPSEDVFPELVSFYVGPDANPAMVGEPPAQGTLYQADAFFPHPDFDYVQAFNDIGLVHLASAVVGAEEGVVAVSAGESVGMPVLHVGYGALEGVEGTGVGVKRSAYAAMSGFDEISFWTDFVDVGLCWGDSGGPGLVTDTDGNWTIAGIASAHAEDAPGEDPCKVKYLSARADTHAAWIEEKLNGPQPSCQETPELCWCDEACLSDGMCDNTACQTLECRYLYYCIAECAYNHQCQKDCHTKAIPEGKVTGHSSPQL